MSDVFGHREGLRSYYSGSAGRVLGQRAENSAAVVLHDYAAYFVGPAVVEDPSIPDVCKIEFPTGKYRPPRRVSVRTSPHWQDIEGDFHGNVWHFDLAGDHLRNGFAFKLVLDGLTWMRGNDWNVPGLGRRVELTDDTVHFENIVTFTTDRWAPNHLVTMRTDADGWRRDLYGVYADGAWRFRLDRSTYPSGYEFKFVLDRRWFMEGDDLRVTPDVSDLRIDETTVAFPVGRTAFRHGLDNFTTAESSDEQRTPFVRGTEQELYDVIVVGSGMGGGVLADAVSDAGLRTLVLEAGGLRFPTHLSNISGHWDGMAPRDQVGQFVNWNVDGVQSEFLFGPHFNLGGRSVYWSGIIPRMRPWEFRGTWPAEVAEYLTATGYDEAERVLWKQHDPGGFQQDLCDHLSARFGGALSAQPLPRSLHQPPAAPDPALSPPEKSRGVFSTADLLLDSSTYVGAYGSANLALSLHHLATGLGVDGDRVTGVVCQDLAGHVERIYHGRVVVLACGSLESPRLALNSRLQDPNGLIGRGLTDHPAWFVQHHRELPSTGELGWIGTATAHAKLLLQFADATPSQHPYNVELLVNPVYWDFRHADPDVAGELIRRRGPSKVELKFVFDSALDDANWVRSRGVGQKLDVFVRRNGQGSGFGNELLSVRNRLWEALGVAGGASSTWTTNEWHVGNEGTVHHAGGTLRMSGDGSGVVDASLRFEAYRNLYACDVSVFPTIPAANPSLTLAALALRLADELRRTLL